MSAQAFREKNRVFIEKTGGGGAFLRKTREKELQTVLTMLTEEECGTSGL
jgi:hypothetical protein